MPYDSVNGSKMDVGSGTWNPVSGRPPAVHVYVEEVRLFESKEGFDQDRSPGTLVRSGRRVGRTG